MRVRLDDPDQTAAWLAELAPVHVRTLDAYQPGKPIEELERELGISGAIKVASNENPLGPSPRAVAAIQAAVHTINLYPDAASFALRRALAARFGVAEGEVAIGAGSNDLLYQLVLALVGPDLREGSRHLFAERRPFGRVRFGCLGQGVVDLVREHLFPAATHGTHGARAVHQDAQQPGAEAFPFLVAAECAVRPKKSVLNDLFGILAVAHEMDGKANVMVEVALDEDRVRFDVSVQDSPNYGGVRGIHR
jgi:hypothetical protein